MVACYYHYYYYYYFYYGYYYTPRPHSTIVRTSMNAPHPEKYRLFLSFFNCFLFYFSFVFIIIYTLKWF